MNRPKDLNPPSRWNMRIWDDDKKEWLCQSSKEALTYYGFDITGGETTEFQGLPKWHPDRRLIWEQSTGFKDKNGKEIYEGDIVSIHNKSHKNEYDIGVIEFKKGAFRCPFLLGKYQSGQIEVIGNIHETQNC